MKIVTDINHPAHVHFFKNFIRIVEDMGHEVLVTASEKDVALKLLDHYGLSYKNLGSYGRNYFQKVILMPVLDYKMYQAVKDFKPDIFLGLGSIRAAHVAKLMGKPVIAFDDTEHSHEQHILYVPFVNIIFTPSSFKRNLGKKQIYYNGFHELAYLHPKYFTPDSTALEGIGLTKNDIFFIIRFAAFNATHDTRSKNIRKDFVKELIIKLEQYGRVIISSEIKLDDFFIKYQYTLSPTRFHDILYYCSMYIGEGSTSAEEAALLGVPSIHFERIQVNGKSMSIVSSIGVLDELQNKYGLLYSYCEEEELMNKVEEILANKAYKK